MMKHTSAWIAPCLATTLTLVGWASGAEAQQTINPSGGTMAGDGLRTTIGPRSQLQIVRQGSGQVYSPSATPPSASLYNGFFVAVGTTVYGSGASIASSSVDTVWTGVSQTPVSGSGTSMDPYQVTTVMDGGSSGLRVTQTYRYVAPNDYIDVQTTVTPPAGNTAAVKAYHIIDTYLAGGDSGAAYRQPATGNPTVIGVEKSGQYEVFIQGDRAWDRFYSARYSTPFSEINNGGDLSNSFDTNPATDNGMGVQWNLGAASGPITWTHRIAFTTSSSSCGDGVPEGFEGCDDGNMMDGDGCSRICQVEAGYVCMGAPSTCAECFSDVHCDDGNDCTADTCGGSNTCSNTPIAAGTACSAGVCDGASACVECVGDAQCGGSTPFCDSGTNTCRGCLSGADCTDGNECTADVCTLGACTNPPRAPGSTCSGGVCNGLLTPSCVGCVADGDCGGSTPYCDTSSSTCVGCTTDGHCDDGNACTADACTGGTCGSAPEPAGTTCPGGVCDGSVAAMCVTCVSDAQCGGATPYCDVASNACVGCLTAAQCADGNACTADACVGGSCANLPEPPGTTCTGGVCDGSMAAMCVACLGDSDCGGATPYCDTASNLCVACTTDTHCDDGNACTTDSCSAGTCGSAPVAAGTSCGGGVCDAAATCVGCLSDTDCGGATPYCEVGSSTCVGCTLDVHCDDGNDCTSDVCTAGTCGSADLSAGTACAGGVCDGAAMCVGCLLDSDCDGGTPFCDVATSACVACLDDGACDDGDECTVDTCSAGVCGSVASPAGTACSAGVCDGATTPTCVGCLGDGDCGGDAAYCDVASATCVGCTMDDQCDDADECTADACAGGACGATPLAAGTPCSSGVCDGEATPACVECLADTDCPADRPVCDPAALTCGEATPDDAGTGGGDASVSADGGVGDDAGSWDPRGGLSGGACSVSHGDESYGGLGLLALGFAVVALRRRRR